MQISLAGQAVLVTGASSGIGASAARALAAAGAAVAVNYRSDAEAAARVVADIRRRGGEALAVQADVADEGAVQEMFATTLRNFGRLDVLVNNAGIQRDAALTEMTLDDWSKVIGTNLTGAFLCAREAAKAFLHHSADRSRAAGKIIFVSSVHEVIPWAGHVNYAASKGGLDMLMKSIAQELAPRRIRVNSVAPGAIKTDINRPAWERPEDEARLLELIPYGRVGETGDVAQVIVWLASDASDYVTGASIVVDGGMMLYPGFREGG